MEHLSKEEDSQINRQYLQSMLCTKELYAPGASRANMAMMLMLNKTSSAVRVFWCKLCRCGHQIKACPGVAFACCLIKKSETRNRTICSLRCCQALLVPAVFDT